MMLEVFRAEISFKHLVNRETKEKKLVQGELVVDVEAVKCLHENELLKAFPYDDMKSVEANPKNCKMRFKGKGSKKLNITFIGEDALNNLSYAKEVIDKRLKQKAALKKKAEEPNRIVAERRARELARDENLKKAFNKFVKKEKIMTYEQFWNDFEKNNSAFDNTIGLENNVNYDTIEDTTAEFNIQRLFGDVERKDEVSITVTQEQQHLIFTNIPKIKLLYFEQVPRKINRKEFWTKFLRSHYFLRDGFSVSRDKSEIDELFYSYFENKKNGESPRKKRKLNPLIDLSSSDLIETRLNRDTSIAKKGEWVNKMNNLSSSLIDGLKKNGDANIESEMVDTEFKDLKKNMGQKNYIQLEMNNEVYQMPDIDFTLSNKMKKACAYLANSVAHDRITFEQCVQNNHLVWSTLNRKMRTVKDKERLPRHNSNITRQGQEAFREQQVILEQYQFIVTEILRHFWNCFPLSKSSKIILQKLLPKLEYFRDEIKQKKRHKQSDVFDSLNDMLELAHEKYSRIL